MNPMAVKAIQSIVRFVLAMLTGWLVTHKIWSESDAAQYLEIGSLAVVTLGWSLWEKYHGLLMIQAARLLPAHTPMVVVKEKADSGTVTTTGPAIAILLAVVLGSLTLSGCASVDKFNKIAADVTHDAIVASENNRCAVHPAPCLSQQEFVDINTELYKVSVAGREFTKLRIAGKASAADVSTFLAVISQETGVLSKAFPDGRIGAVLVKLIELQAQAVSLLGSKG